jgi:MFS family permease
MAVSVFFGMTGGMLFPYLAIYLSRRYALGPALVGLLFTSLGAVALPGMLASGHLSDLWGRRRILIGGFLAATVAFVVLGLAGPLAVAVAAMAGGWLSFALLDPVYQATVTDVAGPGQRDLAFAWTYAAGNAGFAVGPLIGGLLVSWSYLLLFLGIAASTGTMAALVMLTLRESAPLPGSGGEHQPSGHVWQDRRFLVLAVLLLGSFLVWGQIDVSLPLWVVGRLHYPIAFVGLMLSLNGTMIALSQVTVTGLLRGRRRTRILALASVVYGFGFAMLALPWAPRCSRARPSSPPGRCCLPPRSWPPWPCWLRPTAAANTRARAEWPRQPASAWVPRWAA